jgi:hypothetical protein
MIGECITERALSSWTQIPAQIKAKFTMTKSTLTKTKCSRNRVAFCQGIGLETAAIAALASPLGIIPMGTFPSSLIALARITRRDFDDALTLRPNSNPGELRTVHNDELSPL